MTDSGAKERFVSSSGEAEGRSENPEDLKGVPLLVKLLTSSSLPFGICYPDGRLCEFNDAALNLLGYTREELSSLNWIRDLTPPEWLAQSQKHLQELEKTGVPVRYEKEYIKKGGKRVPVELLVHQKRDAEGKTLYYYTFILDISRQKEAQRKLQDANERFRQLLLASPSVLYTMRSDGDFGLTFVSENVAGMLGYHARKYTSEPGFWIESVHPEDLPEVLGGLTELKKSSHIVLEYRLRRRDGRYIWVRDERELLPGAQGDSPYVVGSLSDVTKEKMEEARRFEAERNLWQYQKNESLGIMAGGIAHDFNNILTGILGNAELALGLLDPGSGVRENIEAVIASSRRAAELTDKMLAYSGRGSFHLAPLSLARVVRESSDVLRSFAPLKCSIRYLLDEDAPRINADPDKLRQLLTNLVSNSAEALESVGGTITVAVRALHLTGETQGDTFMTDGLPEGDYVALEVSDTGCGIDKKIVANIFDPFFTTKFAGRGLGLSAVIGIAKAHGAAVRVKSETGKGATFEVLFPALPRLVQDLPGTPGPESNWKGSGAILVIDDEEIVRTILERMLTTAGFEVVTAKNGLEGLEKFKARQGDFRVVLLDMGMPEMNGAEVFKRLRALKPDVKVILVTGLRIDDVAREFREGGLVGMVQKPFHYKDLINQIRCCL
ncbi:PAS domain S-box protein [bacterium]|nr:MAG: PAS domain S-box protein [bacterium]